MLARMNEHARIRVVHHGRVANLEPLQMQELRRNHDGRGVHRARRRAVAMVRANSHREIRRVKNRPLARIRQVMNPLVVALSALCQENARRHLVPRVKHRIVQVVNDAATHPHRIARMHHSIRLVQRRERLVLRTRIRVAPVSRHIINRTKSMGGRQS